MWGADDLDLARGLGFAHAHDRMVQLTLARLLAQGRFSECLHSSDDALSVDIFMRHTGMARTAQAEAEQCSPAARKFGQAYCDGVNTYLQRHRRPVELMLARYRPEPWTLADVLLILKLLSYLGLAQTQQDLEKFLIQAIRGGASLDRLKALFSPHLDGLDDETVELLQQIRLVDRLVSHSIGPEPALMASNNWAIAGEKTASGRPIQCNDPHLERHALPIVWYEFVGHTRDDDRIGVSIPGIPGLIMGRTRHVSFGLTYGMMDMIDYFIEDCRDGRCRQGSEFVPLQVHRENVLRRGKPPAPITTYENERGMLETDPRQSDLPDGYYLCRAYTAHRTGAAASLDALTALGNARTVAEAQAIVRDVSLSSNWIIADRDGNIGYQQSGISPARTHSGLYPVPGWDAERTWNGFVPSTELATQTNPPAGVLVSANDDWNPPGKPPSINVPCSPYRAERIKELLAEQERWTAEAMERIQTDRQSLQARRLMSLLRPWIPSTPTGQLLAEWDFQYDADSRGATLFDRCYQGLLREVFGRRLFGEAAWDEIASSTCLVAVYHGVFDNVLLGPDESWFEPEGREGLLRQVLSEVTAVPPKGVPTWGEQRALWIGHRLLSEALPGFLRRVLGVDYGPVVFEGSPATVCQGTVYHSHGRLATIAPTWRFITDLGEDHARTLLFGGPSDRVTSKWYAADLDRWRKAEYKVLFLAGEGQNR